MPEPDATRVVLPTILLLVGCGWVVWGAWDLHEALGKIVLGIVVGALALVVLGQNAKPPT